MKKKLFLFALLVLSSFGILYPQTTWINDERDLTASSTNIEQFKNKGGTQTIYQSSSYAIGRKLNTDSSSFISRSYHQFDLLGFPTNTQIDEVTVHYTTSAGTYSYKLTKVSSVGTNDAANWSAIGGGTSMDAGIAYSAVENSFVSAKIKTEMQNLLTSGKIILGALSENETANDSYADLFIWLHIKYRRPAQTFPYYAANYYNGSLIAGQIGVGLGQPPTSYASPKQFDAIENQNINLLGYDNQDIGTRRYLYNDIEAPVEKSKWDQDKFGDFTPLGEPQSITVVANSTNGGATFRAWLKKNCKIDQTHNSEFDGSQTQQNTSYIVEQNNGNITAPSTKPFNGKNYSFAYWSDGVTGSTRTVAPTDNTTFSAFYKYPEHSSTSLGYDKDGQRKVLDISAYDGGIWNVYSSSGNVWLEKNGVVVNGGAPVNILSDGPEAKSPAMDYVVLSNWYSDIFVVYQQKTTNGKYKIKLAKFNGDGQKIYTYDVLTSTMDYAAFDATPVISVTRNPDQASGKTKFNIVWRQKAEGSYQNGLYFMPGMDNGTNITWYYLPPIKINSTDAQSSNPTMAVIKSPRGAAFLYHLAWQQGTSKINYRAIADNWNGSASGGVTEFGNLEEPSYGDGYNLNTEPSITVLNIGKSYDYGVYYYDTPKLVWKTEYESVNHISKTNSTLDGRWQTFYKYYTCDDIPSANISAATDEQTYVIAWSETGGLNNRLIKSTNLSAQILTGTKGKDIQVSNYNELGLGVVLNVFNNVYYASAPFAFQNYYLTNGLDKTNNFVAKEGRFGTVMKGDAEFYFGMGDVTTNNNLVNFIDVNDTLELTTKELLNSYLITEPFEVNDNCNLTYSIIYGVKDSLTAAANLTNTDNIGFKVELIDNTSNVVLGVFDQVIQSKNNIVAYENLSYQMNTTGIGNRTVRIRLVVDPNLDAPKYSLSKIFSDGAPLSKSKINQVNWNGSNKVDSYELSQNYPNPFNPSTTIKFQLPQDGFVTLKIYDILGNEITTLINEEKAQGRYEVNFNASNLASGIYIYKIQAGSFVSSKKMILLK